MHLQKHFFNNNSICEEPHYGGRFQSVLFARHNWGMERIPGADLEDDVRDSAIASSYQKSCEGGKVEKRPNLSLFFKDFLFIVFY